MKKVLILLLWLLPSCSVVILAQTQRIAGTVVVGDGQPAVGAAIVVKEGVRKGYPLFLCKSPNFPKLGLFNLL